MRFANKSPHHKKCAHRHTPTTTILLFVRQKYTPLFFHVRRVASDMSSILLICEHVTPFDMRAKASSISNLLYFFLFDMVEI